MPLNDKLRVTECANPLTEWLDQGKPDDIVRMLAACDGGLFAGYAGLPNVYSDEQAVCAGRVAVAISRALRHPRGRVVFGGCGTSGRLAHLLARELNAWWSLCHPSDASTRFHYLLAGGDAALLVPNEAVEDEHEAGRHDLEAWERAYDVLPTEPTVVVGISCGLSATYVASFLRASASRAAYFPVAMGFNPIGAVAAVVIPGCPFTFHSVLCALVGAAGACALPDGSAPPADLPTRAALLNPVVGPEAVAGSSRMKGGSITWILCSAICTVALALVGEPSPSADMHVRGEDVPAAVVQDIRAQYMRFEGTVRALYGYHTESIASVLQSGASSLTSRVPSVPPPSPGPVPSWPTGSGRILYIGRGAGGLLGLVDASEATDTYGSMFDHVRGWVAGGSARMGVKANWQDPVVPLELRGMHGGKEGGEVPVEKACPSLASFVADIIPTLTPQDTVIVVDVPQPADNALLEQAELQAVAHAAVTAVEKGAVLRHVVVTGPVQSNGSGTQNSLLQKLLSLGSAGVYLPIPADGLVDRPHTLLTASLLGIQAAKLTLNAVTTGAHVSKGVIVGNRMVNMMLTNHKLYLRAIGIVGEVGKVSPGTARRAVLRAVHGEDDREVVESMVQQEDTSPEVVKSRIALASVQERVIPTALLLALAMAQGGGKEALTVRSARALLEKEPAVRAALELI